MLNGTPSTVRRLADLFTAFRGRPPAEEVARLTGTALAQELSSLPRAPGFADFELVFEHTGEKHAFNAHWALTILADDRPPPAYLPKAHAHLPPEHAHRVRPDLYRKEDDSSQLYHRRTVERAGTPLALHTSVLVAVLHPVEVTIEGRTLTCAAGPDSVSVRDGQVVAFPTRPRLLGFQVQGDTIVCRAAGVHVYIRGGQVIITRQEHQTCPA